MKKIGMSIFSLMLILTMMFGMIMTVNAADNLVVKEHFQFSVDEGFDKSKLVTSPTEAENLAKVICTPEGISTAEIGPKGKILCTYEGTDQSGECYVSVIYPNSGDTHSKVGAENNPNYIICASDFSITQSEAKALDKPNDTIKALSKVLAWNRKDGSSLTNITVSGDKSGQAFKKADPGTYPITLTIGTSGVSVTINVTILGDSTTPVDTDTLSVTPDTTIDLGSTFNLETLILTPSDKSGVNINPSSIDINKIGPQSVTFTLNSTTLTSIVSVSYPYPDSGDTHSITGITGNPNLILCAKDFSVTESEAKALAAANVRQLSGAIAWNKKDGKLKNTSDITVDKSSLTNAVAGNDYTVKLGIDQTNISVSIIVHVTANSDSGNTQPVTIGSVKRGLTSIKGTGTPGDTITIKITSADSLSQTYTAPVLSDGTWTCPLSKPLAAGDSIVATGTIGRDTSTVKSLTIDIVRDTSTNISGTANPGDTITIKIGDTTIGTALTNSDGIWKLDKISSVVAKGGTISATNGTDSATRNITTSTTPTDPTTPTDTTSTSTTSYYPPYTPNTTYNYTSYNYPSYYDTTYNYGNLGYNTTSSNNPFDLGYGYNTTSNTTNLGYGYNTTSNTTNLGYGYNTTSNTTDLGYGYNTTSNTTNLGYGYNTASNTTDLGYGFNTTSSTSSNSYSTSSSPVIVTSGTPVNDIANVEITAKNITVTQGSSFKVLKNVKAIDDAGRGKNIKKITAQGKVNTKVPGTYPITYTSTGSNGVKVSKTVYVTVK